jgi:riboflavin synthase
MFTGLVETTGRVDAVDPQGDAMTLTVHTTLDPGPIGASLAVDGVCLTVTGAAAGVVRAVVGPETLARTTLGLLQPGAVVNLERPLRLGDRLGGHMVSGHVDAVGKIARKAEIGPAVQIWIQAPSEVLRYVVVKGSIAVDGISLTVNQVAADAFEVTLIPHTRTTTTLDGKPVGAAVNLESDIIGKYVERLLGPRAGGPASGITLDRLKECGFAD